MLACLLLAHAHTMPAHKRDVTVAEWQVVLGMALPGIEKQANSWPHIDLGATSYYSAADSIIREAGLINQDSRATLLKESLSPRMFSAFFTPAANPFTSGNCHTVPQVRRPTPFSYPVTPIRFRMLSNPNCSTSLPARSGHTCGQLRTWTELTHPIAMWYYTPKI